MKSAAASFLLEPRFFGYLFAVTAALWLFLGVAEEVGEGEAGAIDARIMLALHGTGLHGPTGPRWLEQIARDVTALGSGTVLGLIVVAACGFLLLARRYRTALLVLVTTTLSAVLSIILKLHFDRARPALIPHDIPVATASFPSGHAMLSATVYLMLAAVLVRLTSDIRMKVYVLCVATLLSGLVGLSRIYLGVHWPSDVLAGWAAGAGWALAVWGVAEVLKMESSDR